MLQLCRESRYEILDAFRLIITCSIQHVDLRHEERHEVPGTAIIPQEVLTACADFDVENPHWREVMIVLELWKSQPESAINWAKPILEEGVRYEYTLENMPKTVEVYSRVDRQSNFDSAQRASDKGARYEYMLEKLEKMPRTVAEVYFGSAGPS